MTHVFTLRSSLSLLICASTLPVWAAESSTELPATTVVGAAIIDQNHVDRFASLATVVGEQQVRDLNALDLSSALRRTPGVTVSRFNPVGSLGGSVYIRGVGVSRPVAIDGQRRVSYQCDARHQLPRCGNLATGYRA